MKVVVVGSGGREHALALVLARHAEVVVTPGNPAIPGSVDTPVFDLVADGTVDLVVFGPELPLVAGHADQLRAMGVRVFGPGAEGAKLDKIAQLGRRQFAYNARHLESGHYVNYTFQGSPEVITKIQSRLRLNGHVHLQHFVRVA